MHSRSSNISNKNIQKRWFFTHKRCSFTTLVQFHVADERRTREDIPAARQQLTVILETKTRWRTLHSQQSPSLSLRQRKTLVDKPPRSSAGCCLLSALLGLIVASNAWFSAVCPARARLVWARLRLCCSVPPAPSCTSTTLSWAQEETEQNAALLEDVPFFPSPGTNPLAAMM